ncbi:MAG: ABC transporter permease [Thermoanaerobaculaceae bacterium]|nr:ABC transporter permease [Thermoanaerobaculaceae bacterium]
MGEQGEERSETRRSGRWAPLRPGVLGNGARLALGEAIRTSLSEVWAHKLRSSLTLLGVILGTMAVVVMVTLIEGIRVMVWEGFYSLGYDGVMFVTYRPPDDPTERKKLFQSRGLSVRDVEALEAWGESFQHVAALNASDSLVQAEGEQLRVRVFGVTPSYGVVRNRQVSKGRWLLDSDQRERRKVAVLGADLAERLFGTRDPIGREVKVAGDTYRVVGVESRIGNNMANDGGWSRREMNGVLVPLATFRTYLRGGQRVGALMIKTEDKEQLAAVSAELSRLVRRSHSGVGDFRIEDVASEMLKASKEIGELLRNWTVVLASMAGISLLVGGVGIYSVMKISLVERLFEIGLRKAIGASDRTILAQFLIESVSLSALGGLLGCSLGAALCAALSPLFEAGLPLSPLGLALGIGFAVAVGAFAGVFPSLAAARLTPVEALRA